MEQKFSRQFFLGANTGAGFVSLYPAFAAALRKIGYQGIYMLELRRCTPENLIRSRERLIQCL